MRLQDTRKESLPSDVTSVLRIDPPGTPIGIMTATWSNKCLYAQRHGYCLYDSTPAIDRSRPHAWSKMGVAMTLLDLAPGEEPSWLPSLRHQECSIPRDREEREDGDAGRFDWVLYLDADIVITNDSITLDALVPQEGDGDIVFAEDVFGLNSGVWLVRNTEWARGLLREWSDMDGFVRVRFLLTALKYSPEFARLPCFGPPVPCFRRPRLPWKSSQRCSSCQCTGCSRAAHTDHSALAQGNETTKSGDNDALLRLLSRRSAADIAEHVRIAPQCSMNSYLWRWSPRQLLRWLRSPVFISRGNWQHGDFILHLAGFSDKFTALRMLKGKWRQRTDLLL